MWIGTQNKTTLCQPSPGRHSTKQRMWGCLKDFSIRRSYYLHAKKQDSFSIPIMLISMVVLTWHWQPSGDLLLVQCETSHCLSAWWYVSYVLATWRNDWQWATIAILHWIISWQWHGLKVWLETVTAQVFEIHQNQPPKGINHCLSHLTVTGSEVTNSEWLTEYDYEWWRVKAKGEGDLTGWVTHSLGVQNTALTWLRHPWPSESLRVTLTN